MITAYPIEEIVERAMQHLPIDLDLAKPEHRKRLHDWMVRIGGMITQQNKAAFSRSAASAIAEAARRTVDPNYHEKRKKTRLARAERRRLDEIFGGVNTSVKM